MTISEVDVVPEASGATRPRLTVVVPTRNEAGNVDALLEAIRPLMDDLVGEVLFVDDSDDETPDRIEAAARRMPVPVTCIHRSPGERTDGLAGAVLLGFAQAAGEYVAVMDGDLQHPPAHLRVLAAALDEGADLACATRYVGGGSNDGLDGGARRVVSKGSTLAAKLLFPKRLRGVSDPMSGFFAVRRSALDLETLRPTGFKILLELLVRLDVPKAERSYSFGDRFDGDSKASLTEGLRYLRHLIRLRLDNARLRRAVAFGAVGATGLLVNHLALLAAVEAIGVGYGLGAVLATQASTAWNFALNDGVVFRGATEGSRWSRFGRFWATNNGLLLLRIPLLALLVSGAGMQYLLANQLTFAGLFAARFFISDRLVWGAARPGGNVNHHYDIAGVVTISSAVKLRELSSFAVDRLPGAADIQVKRERVGRTRPGRPHLSVSAGAVEYREHLGGLFSNFSVDTSGPIEVKVSPLLARSPHVVYTNIVEALLRFVLVSRGYMLLHSAAFEIDGVGVMLSARTDTGKTGTILRLVREKGAIFLSDDMTIVRAGGVARSFPKPLTISSHTLAAVKASPMGRWERSKLAVQSRIHSKGGRSFGAWLAERNLPIMSFNAFTQMVVPPPKYMIDKLVATTYGVETTVRELFVIERGEPLLAAIDDAGARTELLENTDDAYGFPPFAQFAPAITIDGDGYLTLRAKEEAILASFLEFVNVRRLVSNSFSWADDIPALLAAERVVDLTTPVDVAADVDVDAHRAPTAAVGWN